MTGVIAMAEVSRQLDDAAQMQVWEEYRTWLIAEGLAFVCTEAEARHYPRLSGEWAFPAVISNCIIDAYSDTGHINNSLLHQLEALCCNFMQLRFFAPVDKDWLEDLMRCIGESQMKAVSLVLAFKKEPCFLEELERLMDRYIKIQELMVHGCDREDTAIAVSGGRYIQTTAVEPTALHCGVVAFENFAVNVPAFTEALKYNTCLNRKLSIDAAGYIKNCPSMTESYGHIKDTTLAEALAQPGLKNTGIPVKTGSPCVVIASSGISVPIAGLIQKSRAMIRANH